jgi:hypothetical protein
MHAAAQVFAAHQNWPFGSSNAALSQSWPAALVNM